MKNDDYVRTYQRNQKHIPLREVLNEGKIRFFLGLVIVLWVAVGTQFVAKRLFQKDGDIMDAFTTSNSGLMESTLEMTAEYSDKYLTAEDKKTLVAYIAKGLGIVVDSDMQTNDTTQRQETTYIKQAAKAQTTIKVVTVGNRDVSDAFIQASEKKDGLKQYIMVRIMIYEDANNDILAYREMLEKIYNRLEIGSKKINTTLQLCGSFSGNLMLDTKNKLADRMIDSLDGKVVFENREEALYTVYAYTGLLREYILVDKNKINIQVAITYDEQNDCTKIYLATPILSGDW